MNLITTAHLGEAQAFIEAFKLSKVSEHIFEGSDLTLLITGEGPFEAAIKTSWLLGKKNFSQIYNLGVAGALDPTLELESIHAVRSSYLFLNSPQFKSFPLSQTGLDCLTSFERVLKEEDALKMRGVATLVDRELWGIASSAKEAKVPLKSFKLISDRVGIDAICDLALEKSLGWSQKLLAQYESLTHISAPQKSQLHLDGFYFTFSSEHQFKNLMEKLRIKEALSIGDLPLEDFKSKSKLPKDRTKFLLSYLEQRLDPVKGQISSQIESWKKPFEKEGVRIDVDPKWEDDRVKISFEVKSDEELQHHLQDLKHFSIRPYGDLLKGKIHVE